MPLGFWITLDPASLERGVSLPALVVHSDARGQRQWLTLEKRGIRDGLPHITVEACDDPRAVARLWRPEGGRVEAGTTEPIAQLPQVCLNDVNPWGNNARKKQKVSSPTLHVWYQEIPKAQGKHLWQNLLNDPYNDIQYIIYLIHLLDNENKADKARSFATFGGAAGKYCRDILQENQFRPVLAHVLQDALIPST